MLKEEYVVEVENLHKSFGEKSVLDGFDLRLKKGENLVVLGKSGSGKSVLIKCIVGLLEFESGNIRVLGKSIAEMPQMDLDAVRSRIGFVFQNSALYDSMTVRENLEFPLRRHPHSMTPSEIQELIEHTLNDVGLLPAIDMMPSELSGGMRKRVGLARSLILHPEIMLYDEPTTGLDPITAREIINLMLTVRKKYNTSSIVISHDMRCARSVADRLSVLSSGKNYMDGTFDYLKNIQDPVTLPFFE